MDWIGSAGLALALACLPACAPDEDSDAQESSTTGVETPSESSHTEPDDMGAWGVSPDCTALVLPGTPQMLASTPREHPTAELLALATNPAALVAPDDAYEVIAADLEAIVALDPALGDIEPECSERRSMQMWWEDSPMPCEIFFGLYKAWDCHNEHFGVSVIRRLDGLAYGLEFEKILGEPVLAAYQTLPGFADADLSQCWYREGLCDPDCTENAWQNIELDYQSPTEPRTYRFVSRFEESPIDVRYRVAPGEPPELLP